MTPKKKTYQFDLKIRLIAESESVDGAFEAAIGKLDPDYVQIRSEVSYKEVTRDEARIDPNTEIETGIITKSDIGVAEFQDGLENLLEDIFGMSSKPKEPTPEELLKGVLGEDN